MPNCFNIFVTKLTGSIYTVGLSCIRWQYIHELFGSALKTCSFFKQSGLFWSACGPSQPEKSSKNFIFPFSRATVMVTSTHINVIRLHVAWGESLFTSVCRLQSNRMPSSFTPSFIFTRPTVTIFHAPCTVVIFYVCALLIFYLVPCIITPSR